MSSLSWPELLALGFVTWVALGYLVWRIFIIGGRG